MTDLRGVQPCVVSSPVVLAAQEHLQEAECQARKVRGLLWKMASGFMCLNEMLPTNPRKISRGFLAAALPAILVRLGLGILDIRGMELLQSLANLAM